MCAVYVALLPPMSSEQCSHDCPILSSKNAPPKGDSESRWLQHSWQRFPTKVLCSKSFNSPYPSSSHINETDVHIIPVIMLTKVPSGKLSIHRGFCISDTEFCFSMGKCTTCFMEPPSGQSEAQQWNIL